MATSSIQRVSDIIRARFERELDLIVQDFRDEVAQQGHVAMGELVASFEKQVTESVSDSFVGTIFAADHWRVVDTGVSASRIPYTPGRRSGKSSSKYIQALLDWAETVKPGLSERERKSFVFAVAATHSREGMPTRGSYSFSRNGRRTNFVQEVLDKHINTLAESIASEGFLSDVSAQILRA